MLMLSPMQQKRRKNQIRMIETFETHWLQCVNWNFIILINRIQWKWKQKKKQQQFSRWMWLIRSFIRHKNYKNEPYTVKVGSSLSWYHYLTTSYSAKIRSTKKVLFLKYKSNKNLNTNTFAYAIGSRLHIENFILMYVR